MAAVERPFRLAVADNEDARRGHTTLGKNGIRDFNKLIELEPVLAILLNLGVKLYVVGVRKRRAQDFRVSLYSVGEGQR
jgi:hypothetical protein